MLLDLFRHQAWADAEHWRALKAAPEALDDHAIRERLCHLHLVQQAFLWAVRARGDRFTAWKPEDYPDLRALEVEVRTFHETAIPYVAALGDGDRAGQVTIPWFKDPPLVITREEALTQAPGNATPLGRHVHETIERAAREIIAPIAEKVAREVAWEVIPDLAESLVRRRIRELEGGS